MALEDHNSREKP